MSVFRFLSFGVGLGLALFAAGCSDPEMERHLPSRPIAWAEVGAVPEHYEIRLPARVRAVDRVGLAFEVGGRVAAVHKRTGDAFVEGEMLAALDDRIHRLRVAERESALEEARSSALQASRDFERVERLQRSGAVAEQEVDLARQVRDTWESRRAQAEAALHIARKQLADTMLFAPYNGTVAERLIEPAQQVEPGRVVFELQGKSELEVIASVPIAMIQNLKIGSSHFCRIPEPSGALLPARLTEVSSRASDGTAIPITLRLLELSAGLHAGSAVEVVLQVSRSEASSSNWVEVPTSAFLAGPGETMFCFVYDPATETIRKRQIFVGEVGAQTSLVSAGLAVGEIVATKGLPFLREGEQVTLLGSGIARYNP